MKVLLAGAGGFIAGRLRRDLYEAGHELVLGLRTVPPDLRPRETWLPIDFTRPDPARWQAGLVGVDCVFNGIGILREQRTQSFAALHVEGPRRLLEACLAAGVRRIVHLSALGADADAQSAYHRSKREGDALVLAAPLEAFVVQPSLVFGPGGASARLFVALASLPLLMLPAGGRQRLQPIHLDDLAEALMRLVVAPPSALAGRRLALAGPRALELCDYLRALRRSLGLEPAPAVAVPSTLVSLAATIGSRLPQLPFDRETWGMLQRGNVAPADDTRALLGREPREVEEFIPRGLGVDLRRGAALAWLLPLLRISVALVWLWTAVVSLGLYPVEASFELLARTGLTGPAASLALYGAALLDLAFGVASLAMRRRRRLWLAQIVLVLGYTAIISVRLPEFWLHPYGPVLKNLPLLAVLLLLWTLDDDAPARRGKRGA
jgi:uncharacterized protein YbjT (DUF2867 family)